MEWVYLRPRSNVAGLLFSLTACLLTLEYYHKLPAPSIDWRGPQRIGNLNLYLLVTIVTLLFITLSYKMSIITKKSLTAVLKITALYTATLYPVYLLKIILGRGGLNEEGRFLTREIGLFPSGHTYTALLTFSIVYYLIILFSKNNLLIFLYKMLASILIGLMAVSLYISSDHYLSDITMSFFIYSLVNTLISKFILVNSK